MSTDPFISHKIHFLGELEGPPVQEFKHQLSAYLSCEHQIRKAFLVRINREESPKPRLALCLVGERTNAIELARTVGAIFKELFPGADNMEVVFLNDPQIREVTLLAQPFYVSDGSDQCRPN
ncbi:enhanced serine sensitivity protein SseB [Acidobacteria bacterium AB60]|nr:enhanced serine sensitivity protein SseB [Acidobacteria bacterium AB60]